MNESYNGFSVPTVIFLSILAALGWVSNTMAILLWRWEPAWAIGMIIVGLVLISMFLLWLVRKAQCFRFHSLARITLCLYIIGVVGIVVGLALIQAYKRNTVTGLVIALCSNFIFMLALGFYRTTIKTFGVFGGEHLGLLETARKTAEQF